MDHAYDRAYVCAYKSMERNRMGEVAFITGITGQDGSYLSEFLLEKGYEVHGLVRWDAVDGTQRLCEFKDRLHLHTGDLTDANNITALIQKIQPDEIYNLAALSHVKVSFETPSSAFDINTKGSLNIFDAVRICGLEGKTRIYQASSSEMFGSSSAPQNEETAMKPCSPYGVAKLASYHLGQVYRDSYGMFISNGILFNHESPVRGEDFVTRKITKAVAAIEAGAQESLTLGNLDALRDWGHARDYIRGMWMMLQHEVADDFVLATGEAHSVRDFVERSFAFIGVKIHWRGEGTDEIGFDPRNGKVYVRIDPALYRPNEVDYLLGESFKARRVLSWKPEFSFDDLVADMVNADRREVWSGDNQWQMVS